MESQMYGTPVLGADIGGIPELIESGKTGLLFESGSAADLKEKIEKLWNDRQVLDEMTQNCTPDRFTSLERYTEELMKYYG
jgi:glycosyltransferase involved in cell wall biosynthesis